MQERMTTEDAKAEIAYLTTELAAYSDDNTTARRKHLKENPEHRDEVLRLTERRHHLNRMIRRNTERNELELLREKVAEKDGTASAAMIERDSALNRLQSARRDHLKHLETLQTRVGHLTFQRNAWCVGMILAVAICLLAEAV